MRLHRREPPDFTNNIAFDTKILCGQKSYYTHRLVLAASSVFLKDIIQDALKEGEEEQVTILLHDFDHQEVELLLNLLHPNKGSYTLDTALPTATIPDLFSQLKVEWNQPDTKSALQPSTPPNM